MAVLHAGNTAGHLQTQLTRSLEKILEDAHHSGELKLSNRKLKDLPINRKYDLSDTVIADLSKNRLSELPEDVTSFYFLEKLQCYHNAIRSVPETIGGLQCLSYLDLSRNQLTTLPRELCLLPIQIFLVSNNRLAALPDDLHRMSALTELDASCNQLTHLPSRLAELTQLQSLVLRGNLLLCVPLDITALPLTRLDLRANRIGVLPVEMRDMSELVELYVEENPLTAPPASLCKRGRVHIFKYLETEAIRLGYKVSVIGSGTLSRRGRKGATLHNSTASTTMTPPANLPERLRSTKRQNVDSGYSTSDDKRWSQEMSGDIDRHWTSSPLSNRLMEGRSANSTPSTISPGPEFNYDEECKTAKTDICDRRDDNRNSKDFKRVNSAASDAVQANAINGHNLDDKTKPLQQIQTYREYKEALRQQRAQDGPAVYRTRAGGDTDDPPTANTAPTTPTHHHYSVGAQHGGYGHYLNAGNAANNGGPSSMVRTSLATSRSDPTPLNSLLNSSRHVHHVVFDDTSGTVSPGGSARKPVQKVTPLRSVAGVNATVGNNFDCKNGSKYSSSDDPTPPTTNSLTTPDNKPEYNRNSIKPPNPPTSSITTNPEINRNGTSPRLLHQHHSDYIKPSSPIMNANNVMGHDNIPSGACSTSNGRTPTKFSNGVKIGKTISWSNGASDTDAGGGGGNGVAGCVAGAVKDKMTFTMRREIDKAKEETDLINQLRNAIECRLKMQLPYDLAPSLTDGVVLCHLANVIKPRSVASIHVPSPAVPKLTMARCRRNVDNFIEACRKIGVDEAQLCGCVDVTEALCAPGGRGLPRLLTTVLALCDCQHQELCDDDDQNKHDNMFEQTEDIQQPNSVLDKILRYTELGSSEKEMNPYTNIPTEKIAANVKSVGNPAVITTKDVVLSYMLLGVFLITLLMVIVFPPPN